MIISDQNVSHEVEKEKEHQDDKYRHQTVNHHSNVKPQSKSVFPRNTYKSF